MSEAFTATLTIDAYVADFQSPRHFYCWVHHWLLLHPREYGRERGLGSMLPSQFRNWHLNLFGPASYLVWFFWKGFYVHTLPASRFRAVNFTFLGIFPPPLPTGAYCACFQGEVLVSELNAKRHL